MEQQYRGDTGIIPSWEREYGAAIEALKESEWYSVEGMRTLGFKQRWLKMNKEWVMDELMNIWKEGNNGATNGKQMIKQPEKNKDSGDGAAERAWLREWESGGGKQVLLKQIAKSLGLEENWDREDDDDGELLLTGIDSGLLLPPGKSYRAMPNSMRTARTARTARSGRSGRKDDEQQLQQQQQDEQDVADENNVSDRESEQMDDNLLFTPTTQLRSVGKQPQQEQQSSATTTSAAKHRKHLLSLSYRYFLAQLPPRCTHCSTPATPALPLVFLLSFPLSTVMRRFYARRRRQAAVTARANGHQRLNRELIYERVSREQWAQWLDGEVEWVALCGECALKEKGRRRQGEVTVLDVKKEMERLQRRKQRKKKAATAPNDVSDSSDEDDGDAPTDHPTTLPLPHTQPVDDAISDDDEYDGEQADTAAYWHAPQRDDVGTAAMAHHTVGEYSVSASSVRGEERWAEVEEAELTLPAEVVEFVQQWMDKAQAVLDRRAAVQQHGEQALDGVAHSRAASVSAISISADSQRTYRASVSSDSSRGSSMSRQLHREDMENGLVGLGRLDISSDSASDDNGRATARGRSSIADDAVTRDEDDHTAGVSRQQE